MEEQVIELVQQRLATAPAAAQPANAGAGCLKTDAQLLRQGELQLLFTAPRLLPAEQQLLCPGLAQAMDRWGSAPQFASRAARAAGRRGCVAAEGQGQGRGEDEDWEDSRDDDWRPAGHDMAAGPSTRRDAPSLRGAPRRRTEGAVPPIAPSSSAFDAGGAISVSSGGSGSSSIISSDIYHDLETDDDAGGGGGGGGRGALPAAAQGARGGRAGAQQRVQRAAPPASTGREHRTATHPRGGTVARRTRSAARVSVRPARGAQVGGRAAAGTQREAPSSSSDDDDSEYDQDDDDSGSVSSGGMRTAARRRSTVTAVRGARGGRRGRRGGGRAGGRAAAVAAVAAEAEHTSGSARPRSSSGGTLLSGLLASTINQVGARGGACASWLALLLNMGLSPRFKPPC